MRIKIISCTDLYGHNNYVSTIEAGLLCAGPNILDQLSLNKPPRCCPPLIAHHRPRAVGGVRAGGTRGSGEPRGSREPINIAAACH